MKSVYPIFLLLLLFACNPPSDNAGAKEAESSLTGGAIEVDGTILKYVIEGEGKPALVIGGSIYYPRTFSDNLRKHLKMHFVDMRWFAEYYQAPDLKEYDIQSIADDIEAVRKALKLEDFVLIGHSIHGVMAMEYAKRYPQHLSHLVMIGSPRVYANEAFNTAFNELWDNASQERKEILGRKWNAVQDKLQTLSAADAMVEAYVARSPMYWYDAEYDCSWIWEDVPINMDMSDHIFGTAFANYNMFSDGKKVEVPVMAALGKHDYVVPYTLWEDQYEQVPNFTKIIFEKSGHTPQLEEAALFDEKLITWLNK